MKNVLSILLVFVAQANAGADGLVSFMRQSHQSDGVVWDMPVAAPGTPSAAPLPENGGSLFQVWMVEESTANDHLMDQKLVGAYLPAADIRITTLDASAKVPRTRVDQPFIVNINLSGLLPATDFPKAASTVLLERHLGSYGKGMTALKPTEVIAGNPVSRGYLSANGRTSLRFDASSINAADPTKAAGEEHFVIHVLSGGKPGLSRIASGLVQVWPVASGEIKGIAHEESIFFQIPKIELVLSDLYPRSDTYLMLFEGTQVTGAQGSIVMAHPLDRETSESTVIAVTELDSKIIKDGTYTLALISDTVYGRELLCKPVIFHLHRALQASLCQNHDP